jgi:uncharacterized protein
MSIETAQKAIDFYLDRSLEIAEPTISFYGGEPLLEIDLIKQCVEYSKSKVEGRKIKFAISTNGTLLSDSTVDFLVKNDFHLSISLDGSRKEHNVNRKFSNGEGSFDIIINNINRIRQRYPQYDKRILILTTINPHIDLSCVLEYFSTSNILNDKNIMFNEMSENDLKIALNYDQDYYRVRNYEYVKMLFSMIDKLDKKYVSKLTLSSKSNIARRFRNVHRRAGLTKTTHHMGPCIPGVQRLFVSVDGSLFPCEKVNETKEYIKIGDIENGFDENQMKKLLNIGAAVEDKCIECWMLRQCSRCISQIEFSVEPSVEDVLSECHKTNSGVRFSLYELAVLREFGFKPEERSAV